MHLLLHLITVIILAFISYQHEAIAQFIPPNFTSIVFPVTKHTDIAGSKTPLYSVEMIMSAYVNSQHANFLIDIDAPLIWHDCILRGNISADSCPTNSLCAPPISCNHYECTKVRTAFSYDNSSCPPVTNSSTLPGLGYCTCSVNVVNPITGSCSQAMLNYDEFKGNKSNGRNVFSSLFSIFPTVACAPSSSFDSFPVNVTGVMAFSKSPYALQADLFQPVKKTLAICLPSDSSTPGVLFLGAGPYHFLGSNWEPDVRDLLSYTPLLNHPNSTGYLIGVKVIGIRPQYRQEAIHIIRQRNSIYIPGSFTAKLSTIEPHTILRTDFYIRVVDLFAVGAAGVPLAPPVAPFGLCYRRNATISSSANLFDFPDIEFYFEDGNKWTVYPTNSIKHVKGEVSCLAFVDGGATSEPAIVIGTHQFEDNFVVFDLENSSFGFSSSLLKKKTSCANFNFTVTYGN